MEKLENMWEKNITKIMLLAILMIDIHKVISVLMIRIGKLNFVSSVQNLYSNNFVLNHSQTIPSDFL